MNSYTKVIDNCCDCDYSYIENKKEVSCVLGNCKISTSGNKDKTQITDWCPMLDKNKR